MGQRSGTKPPQLVPEQATRASSAEEKPAPRAGGRRRRQGHSETPTQNCSKGPCREVIARLQKNLAMDKVHDKQGRGRARDWPMVPVPGQGGRGTFV